MAGPMGYFCKPAAFKAFEQVNAFCGARLPAGTAASVLQPGYLSCHEVEDVPELRIQQRTCLHTCHRLAGHGRGGIIAKKTVATNSSAAQMALNEAVVMAALGQQGLDCVPSLCGVEVQGNTCQLLIAKPLELLSTYVKRQGPSSGREAAVLFVQLVAAVLQLHRAGYVHNGLNVWHTALAGDPQRPCIMLWDLFDAVRLPPGTSELLLSDPWAVYLRHDRINALPTDASCAPEVKRLEVMGSMAADWWSVAQALMPLGKGFGAFQLAHFEDKQWALQLYREVRWEAEPKNRFDVIRSVMAAFLSDDIYREAMDRAPPRHASTIAELLAMKHAQNAVYTRTLNEAAAIRNVAPQNTYIAAALGVNAPFSQALADRLRAPNARGQRDQRRRWVGEEWLARAAAADPAAAPVHSRLTARLEAVHHANRVQQAAGTGLKPRHQVAKGSGWRPRAAYWRRGAGLPSAPVLLANAGRVWTEPPPPADPQPGDGGALLMGGQQHADGWGSDDEDECAGEVRQAAGDSCEVHSNAGVSTQPPQLQQQAACLPEQQPWRPSSDVGDQSPWVEAVIITEDRSTAAAEHGSGRVGTGSSHCTEHRHNATAAADAGFCPHAKGSPARPANSGSRAAPAPAAGASSKQWWKQAAFKVCKGASVLVALAAGSSGSMAAPAAFAGIAC